MSRENINNRSSRWNARDSVTGMVELWMRSVSQLNWELLYEMAFIVLFPYFCPFHLTFKTIVRSTFKCYTYFLFLYHSTFFNHHKPCCCFKTDRVVHLTMQLLTEMHALSRWIMGFANTVTSNNSPIITKSEQTRRDNNNNAYWMRAYDLKLH